MKFIEQKRIHIPAKTEFIQRKFLDIPYAQGGERRLWIFICQTREKDHIRLLLIFLVVDGILAIKVLIS